MKRWTVIAVSLVAGLAVGVFTAGPLLRGQATSAPAIPKEITSFRYVVKKVMPAVVSIESRTKLVKYNGKARQKAPFDSSQVPEEFRRFFQDFDFGQAPEMDQAPRIGLGSGFIIDPSGIVLTNFHVVDGADHVLVTLADGRKFTSKNIKSDRRTDLAIVTLDGKGPFPSLAFADSDQMEIGDRVLAVGAPFGLTGSVTAGIISAKGRNGMHMNMYEDFLQTDAAINPGNSGGPLVNLEGKVVGINSAIKSRSGGFQGVGLAIASNLAKHVSQALRTNGVVHRGYLGVQIRDLDPEVAGRLNLPKGEGVVVAEVFDHTPAAKAGIKAGDILTRIAGKKVTSGKALQYIVADLPLHHGSPVQLMRDGKAVSTEVTIEEQPTDFGTASAPAPSERHEATGSVGLANIGIEVADLTDTMADTLGFHAGTHGVVITSVDQNGVAAEAGLRKGMLVTKLDNHKVTSVAQLQGAMKTASLRRGVLLQVQSPQGGVNYVLLKKQ